MKTCNRCNTEKTNKEFHKDKYTKDGLRYACKVCITDYVKEKKEVFNQSKTKWRINNRGLDRHSKRMHELKKLGKVAPGLTEKDVEKILSFYIIRNAI